MEKRSFWKLLLLSFVTCGLYAIYFWYTFNDDVNTLTEGVGKKSPNYIVVILLTFLTCGIYYYVWLYKMGDNLSKTGFTRYNLNIDSGSTIVLWAILGTALCGLGPIIAVYMLINSYNDVVSAANGGYANR